jgi:O-acetylhomoserine (thiol)-lyase
VAVPIYQTTSYQFKDAKTAANLFGLKEFGNIYTRIMNPTCNVLEERVAALEGGVAACAVGSGQAATAMCIQNLAQAGDNIVASTDLYGGTVNLFKNTLRQQGIEVRFADPADPKNFEKLTDEKTRAYYGETLPNPYLRVFPIKEVSDIGRKHGIPLVMDNTAAPVICKPLEHGAAIVLHSLTKFIGGHGTSIGGIVVDGGNFDWIKDRKRQPLLNEPDQSYGGAIWTDAVPVLTGANIPFIIRFRVVLLRDTGAPLAPFNAWQIIQGLETVGLRMKQHCSNAEKVITFLETQKKVKNVIYPTNHQGEIKERAKKYLSGGNGALVGVDLGTVEAGAKFIDSLKMLYHVANIGDARSLAIHPASTTHSQLSPEEQLAAGVTPGYVRLSIGIEHPDDIIADIKQALAA